MHQNRNVFLFSHAAISLCPLVLNQRFFIGGNLIEYVKQWPHVGHIVTDSLEDAVDIASRRNSLCDQINNLLCYFGKLVHVTKQSLMFRSVHIFMAASCGISVFQEFKIFL